MIKLRFEKWHEDAHFSESVEQIFTDAIRCYKAGVYRAALLFSFLAFATVLRERLLVAEPPPALPEDAWRRMRTKLMDEDFWEREVFDATQRQNPVIFPISVDLREQIKYWRNRRNDCAHFKSNEINNAHVEAFWHFVEGNLARITVEGGMQALLAKLGEHYTPALVRRGKDVTPLVAQILSSIDDADLPGFWRQALLLVEPYYRSRLTSLGLDFIAKVFAQQSQHLTKSLTQFIKSDTDLLVDYLGHMPSFVTQLEYDEKEMRNLWHKHLPKSQKALSIYSSLLINRMIPHEEILEANGRFFSEAKEYDVTPVEHHILQSHGFGATIQLKAFRTNAIDKYIWVQERAGLLLGFIENYQLTPLVVKRLCEVFSKANVSYTLKASLNELFENNLMKRAEFLVIMTAEGCAVPKHLTSLAEQALEPTSTDADALAPAGASPGSEPAA